PMPALVMVAPLLPLIRPPIVRSPPLLTVKNWLLPAEAPSVVSICSEFPEEPELITTKPLPGMPGEPSVRAVPVSVYPALGVPVEKVNELKTPLVILLLAVRLAGPCGNTRSSVPAPVGAVPPTQFAAVDHW